MARASVAGKVVLTGALLALSVILLALPLCGRPDSGGCSRSARNQSVGEAQDVPATPTPSEVAGGGGAVGKDGVTPSAAAATDDAPIAAGITSTVCPVAIEGGSLESSKVNGFGRAWRYTSEVGVEKMAESLLAQLQRDGWSLLEASRMDLFGEAWGCVAQRPAEEHVLLVVMVPEKVGGAGDGVSLSRVSVVQIGTG